MLRRLSARPPIRKSDGGTENTMVYEESQLDRELDFFGSHRTRRRASYVPDADDGDSYGNSRNKSVSPGRRGTRYHPRKSVDSITADIDEALIRKARSEASPPPFIPLLPRPSLQLFAPMKEQKKKKNKDKYSGQDEVKVFPYTYDPTISYELLRPKLSSKAVKPMRLNTPLREDQVRFVCISDTHAKHALLPRELPDGDVLIVAGDFTTVGHPKEIAAFNKFLGSLPHRYKVVIAGNHELTFDPLLQKSNYMGFEKLFKSKLDSRGAMLRASIEQALKKDGITDVRQLMTSCIYLEDCQVDIYGISIYGTPWQPAFDNWAFNLPRGQACLDKWSKIPSGIDVLVTHTPPLGQGDLTRNGVRAGDVELINSIKKRIRPKYHVFGHIHEGYGCTTDGYTKYINACICDVYMQPLNSPIIFDLPLPAGFQK